MTRSMSFSKCSSNTAKFTQLLCVLFSLLLLAGCSSEQDQWGKLLTEQYRLTAQKVGNLETLLQANRVKNAQLIAFYAKTVEQQQPDKKELTRLLAKDSTTEGPLFGSLHQRLSTAANLVTQAPQQGQAATEALFSELSAISAAADPLNFNMMLSDPLNVLADLSNGALPRVAALSKEASAQINKDTENYAGQQLVGNPQYGQWQTNSSGTSFWAWYGAYRLLGDLFDNRRIGYSDWGRSRGYSYYNDYGRDAYTSPSQSNRQRTVENTARKKFQSTGKTFQSPYAKTRTGPAQAAAVAKSARSSSSFRSSYSSSSSSNSSSRNSSRSSSRSSFSSK